MLSCQSAVAAVDALPILSCRVPAVGPIMMARGTTSSTILRVDFAGIPYQILKHQPHVMAGVALLTLLVANFSIRRYVISHRVVTGKWAFLCHFLHVS